ncbi:MAG: outer membrane lipoprotein carrier protein LolA [Alphaproteobacteria bacterium]|nr:outer membrane lipoprotein carrier protein LolA [Alphaproteobacteria bacterium]
MRRFLYLIITTLLLVQLPEQGVAAVDTNLPKDVLQAQHALNSLTKVQADFTMTTTNGQSLTGTFYLNRPGKLRFDFAPPIEDFIVADGRFIYFYDAELEEQSNAPIGSTLADFLLRDDIRLSGDIAVTRIMRAAGLLQITLTQSDDPGAGELILGFDEGSFDLRKWRVIDSLGNITEVELSNVNENPVFTRDLFFYIDPKKERSYNE